MEERKQVIKHRVLNEETGQEEIVEKVFKNNVTEERTYITHEWCVNMAKEYKVNDTMMSSFRESEKEHVYEDAEGNTTVIVQINGVRMNENMFIWVFTKPDGEQFAVVVE